RGAAARGVLDHSFEGAPEHRGVGGVRLVFQSSQDTAGDRGNVGVAAPTSDGKSVWHLDQMPVWARGRLASVPREALIGGITHRWNPLLAAALDKTGIVPSRYSRVAVTARLVAARSRSRKWRRDERWWRILELPLGV